MLVFIASGSDMTAANRYVGLSRATCGFASKTLPPQAQGFQNGSCPYSITLFRTAPCRNRLKSESIHPAPLGTANSGAANDALNARQHPPMTIDIRSMLGVESRPNEGSEMSAYARGIARPTAFARQRELMDGPMLSV